METILPKEHYTLIYKTSYGILLSFLYGLYRGYYRAAICPAAVCITSVNYWRYPVNGWRRYLDIAAVCTSLSYHLYIAYNAEHGRQYYIIIGSAALTYPIGYYYQFKGDYWMSTYLHILLHALANIAAIVLYSGLTPSLIS